VANVVFDKVYDGCKEEAAVTAELGPISMAELAACELAAYGANTEVNIACGCGNLALEKPGINAGPDGVEIELGNKCFPNLLNMLSGAPDPE
jgi:hypothetical protein